MTSAQTPDAPVGRSQELAVLYGLLDGASREGRALVVRGEPGVGKTTVLATAARAARDRRFAVLRTAGVQSEAHLPFAGLHELLRPVNDRLAGLPDRQRDALHAVFGLAQADEPDFFVIALATLNLLSDHAARQPLLILVDDAQWLDPSTREVLTFVARRLQSDPIVVLIATREARDELFDRAGVPQLLLTGLNEQASADLLDARAELPPAVRRRVLDLAEGNPLALVELPAAIAALPDEAIPPAWLPLTTRLEQAFAARAAGLAHPTRSLLLVAALNDNDLLTEDLAAASLLAGATVTIADLAPAITALLVSVDGERLRFRHPVVRSAIQQAAGAARRQTAHAALARVIRDEPDRRLWHQAAAAVGPDEALATALEQAATRARGFRGISVAVAAFERAAQLSELASTRGARLLLAAQSAFDMGRHDIVTRLMREAARLDLGPTRQAQLAWLRELFQVGIWLAPDNARAFIGIVEQMQADGDTGLALHSLFSVAQRAWWAEPSAATRTLILHAADRLPVLPDDPQLLVIMAMAAPTGRAATVLDRVRQVRPEQRSDPEVMRLLGLALSVVGAVGESAGYFAAAAGGLRAQGRLGLLAQTLVSHAWSEFLRGDWQAAGSAAQEAGRLARETAQPGVLAVAQLAEAALAAVAGKTDLVAVTTAEVQRMAAPLHATPLIAFTELVRGLAALAAGRHAQALEHLLRLFDAGSPAQHPFVAQLAIADLADAAAGSDRRDLVEDLFTTLEAQATRTPSPILHASLRYARPLLAADDDAEELFRAACNAELGHWPFLRARLLHAYGSWLRHRRRTAESRPQLRSARDAFDVLGAHPWADRVREQLRAAGEASPLPVPDARELLTGQEFQVAVLAAEGLTNREIAEQLFLSHRTVGAHLHRAFPKLGITSRTQLGQALGRTVQRAS